LSELPPDVAEPGSRPRIGIVGGGFLGMTLALRLADAGYRVVLFEAAESTGGLAAPQEIGGFTWDRFYHVVLPADATLMALLDELGVADLVQWANTRTGFYTDGTHYSMSSNWEFLTFPPLGLIDKIRLGLTIFWGSRIKDATRLEAIPVKDWLIRWSGRRGFEKMWMPLLRAKLGDNHSLASAAFIWSYIYRLYMARQTGAKKEVLGYVRGGYAPVLERFRTHLASKGVEIRTGAAAEEVRDEGPSVAIRLRDGETHRVDAAVMTIASSYVPDACPQLEEREVARLSGVVYQGVVCASVLLRKPLEGFYVTNITESWVPFTAVVEMTSLVPTEHFGGYTLAYLPLYLTQDSDQWARSDEDIAEEFVSALVKMYDHISRDDVAHVAISRARKVQALATLNYQAEVLPATITSQPRIFVANSSQIINGTLNLNETITVANNKAVEIRGALTGLGVVPSP